MAAEWGAMPADTKRTVVENNLWRWNVAMGVLHFVQGIIVLVASQILPNAKKFRE